MQECTQAQKQLGERTMVLVEARLRMEADLCSKAARTGGALRQRRMAEPRPRVRRARRSRRSVSRAGPSRDDPGGEPAPHSYRGAA